MFRFIFDLRQCLLGVSFDQDHVHAKNKETYEERVLMTCDFCFFILMCELKFRIITNRLTTCDGTDEIEEETTE